MVIILKLKEWIVIVMTFCLLLNNSFCLDDSRIDNLRKSTIVITGQYRYFTDEAEIKRRKKELEQIEIEYEKQIKTEDVKVVSPRGNIDGLEPFFTKKYGKIGDKIEEERSLWIYRFYSRIGGLSTIDEIFRLKSQREKANSFCKLLLQDFDFHRGFNFCHGKILDLLAHYEKHFKYSFIPPVFEKVFQILIDNSYSDGYKEMMAQYVSNAIRLYGSSRLITKSSWLALEKGELHTFFLTYFPNEIILNKMIEVYIKIKSKITKSRLSGFERDIINVEALIQFPKLNNTHDIMLNAEAKKRVEKQLRKGENKGRPLIELILEKYGYKTKSDDNSKKLDKPNK